MSIAVRFEASRSKFFADFDCFVVLTDCLDAEMLRSGDFCANRQQTTDDIQQMTDKPIALPLAHAHGIINGSSLHEVTTTIL